MAGLGTTLADTILPAWIVLPLAAITLLVIAVHVLLVSVSSLALVHKRLRIANGVIMMFVASLLAYALGVAQTVGDPRSNPAQARAFVLVWLAIVGLLGIVVAIALFDALGSLRTGYRLHRSLRRSVPRPGAPAHPAPGDAPRA
jgi:hypothetical protein